MIKKSLNSVLTEPTNRITINGIEMTFGIHSSDTMKVYNKLLDIYYQ